MRRHWPSLWDCGKIRSLNKRGRVHRIYQWLYGRASFFRSDTSGRTNRMVRTEVTVERQGMTLLMGGATGLDHCPLCGQIVPGKAKSEKASPSPGKILEGDLPADGTSK
jgi:hypothetical protein